MKIKKILIIKPKVEEIFDEAGNLIRHHYIYPKSYNPEHASHICYNFSNEKNLEGGSLAEGMVIYTAEKEEIKALLKEEGVTEINYVNAAIKGKQWKPIMTINGIETPAFNITDWIKKAEISTKAL